MSLYTHDTNDHVQGGPNNRIIFSSLSLPYHDHHHHRKDHNYTGRDEITEKRQCHSESNSFVAPAEQVCAEPIHTASDEADVTLLARPFHTFAPATGKAWPPTVDRRQVGTSSRLAEADLSLYDDTETRSAYQNVSVLYLLFICKFGNIQNTSLASDK